MKMSMVLRSRTASIAADRVSPEVAPTIVACWPRAVSSLVEHASSSWSATSLKASVGPWNSSSRCRGVAERLFSGATSGVSNEA